MASAGRFFESPLQGLGPIERGIPGAVSKEEALLMREYNPQGHSSEKVYFCQINHLFGGAPCAKAGKETIDGLLLCERHALEAKLEGQIECWRGMLFHIELWSREASRRDREDIVGLLEVQRAEATSARQRARTDLDRLRRSDTSLGSWGRAEVLTRGFLKRGSLKRSSLPLPPKAVRPLSLGLRGLRRR